MDSVVGEFLAICLGGGLGSMARAAMSARLTRHMAAANAVFVINASGSFLIGVALGLALALPVFNSSAEVAQWFQFFAIGILGGFTTVSTFALQLHDLWQHAKRRAAVAVGLGSVILCPALAGAGLLLMLLIRGAL